MSYHCHSCGVDVQIPNREQHDAGKRHRRNMNTKNQDQNKHKKAASARRLRRPRSAPSDPPIPGAEGNWVASEEFQGIKSFGNYQCGHCTNQWHSVSSTAASPPFTALRVHSRETRLPPHRRTA